MRNLIAKYGYILSVAALFFGELSSRCVCRYIFHQPEVPEKMKEIIAAKRA